MPHPYAMRRTVLLAVAGAALLGTGVLVLRRLDRHPAAPQTAQTQPEQDGRALPRASRSRGAGARDEPPAPSPRGGPRSRARERPPTAPPTAPADGGTARLTLDPELQREALGLMSAHHLPEAAVVLMDVATGSVLVVREPRRAGRAARPLRRGDRAVGQRLQDRHGRGARRGRAPRARHQAVLLGRRAAHQRRRSRRGPAARPLVHDARRARWAAASTRCSRASRKRAPDAGAARGDGATLRLRRALRVRRARAAGRAAHARASRWSSRARRRASGTRRCRRCRRRR